MPTERPQGAAPIDAPAATDYLGEIAQRKAAMLQVGRDIAGTGGPVDRRPLRALLRAEKVSAYPMAAIFLLSLTQLMHSTAWQVLAPDLGRTFGLGPSFFVVSGLVGQVVSLVVPALVARYVQDRAHRAAVMLLSAALFVAVMPLTALVMLPVGLFLVSLADTATSSASNAVDSSLMIDLYPPRARVRVVTVLTSAGMVASLAGQGAIVLLTGPMGLNWRGVFVALGAVAILCFLGAIRLRDPGYGTYDTQRLRAAAREEFGSSTAAQPRHHYTFTEAVRRIWAVRSMRLMLISSTVATLSGPVSVYLSFYFADQFGLSAFQRALMSLGGTVVGLLSYLALAPIGDRIFQRNPALMFYISGGISVIGIPLSLIQALTTSIEVVIALQIVTTVTAGLMGPAMVVGTMSIVPANLRPHTGAISRVMTLGGSMVATALFGGLVPSLGLPVAIGISGAVGVAAAVLAMVSGRHVRRDQDAMIEEVIEDEAIAQMCAQGRAIPQLAARGIDFSYGSSRVLFGVDFTVEEGERVALLGVNGAGKSTLLRVISGLGIPSKGSVRLDGLDITYLDPHRRVAMGVTQIPGGRAVFRDMSVLSNLRCYGYPLPKRQLDQHLDAAFEAFPRLWELRGRPAGALSGGEQQMLGLAKAFISRPRVLLIDELSLGLAPKVVEGLLSAVKTINAGGTSVVLVEQSVNIALGETDRAYFMEQGEVRFEGSSQQLAEHPELLRSVFLSGVNQ